MVGRVVKWFGIVLGGLIVTAVVGVLIAQRVSDGPMSFVQGGPFKTGDLVEEPVTDWSFGMGKETEFELVGFGTSRIAGYIIHDGVAYMTCDLGFMWNRLEPGMMKTITNLIYVFKHWHEDAVEDGRALVRIDGKIYKANFVKVEDPELNAILRDELETMAREQAGLEFGPRSSEPPNDIWFFRMDPR